LVCGYLPSQFQQANVMVDVESSSSFSSTNTSPLTYAKNGQGNLIQGAYSPGAGGDIVIVRVLYDWPMIGGPLALGLGNQPDGGHLMVATAVFKNEPFQ
jgi:hypothetical protein